MTNDQCTIVHMSDRFLNLLAYTRQDLKEQGNSFYTVIHPDDVAMVRQTITTPKAQQIPIYLQYRVQKKNGEIACLHGEGYFILQNKENHFCCELADITPYDTLLQQYLHIFQSLPNPLLLIDKELKILSMNKAAEQNFNTTLSACQGKPCSIFNTPLCYTPDCCLKRFERGDSAAVQYGPGEQAFRISFARLYSLKGEQIGYISIATDIIELVKIQRELKISEERFWIALSQTRNTIWEYDLATRTIFQSDMLTKATSSIYGLKGIVKNIPDSLMQSGSIHQTHQSHWHCPGYYG